MAIYLKYETPDIAGGVTAAAFTGEIEFGSFQFGIGRGVGSPAGASGNREASTPSISEVVLTKSWDNATGPLVKEALSGDGKATATISFTRTDGTAGTAAYLVITLTNVMISGWSVSSGGDKPSESLSLNFTKIEVKTTPQNPDGTPGDAYPVTYDLGLHQLS